jgi:hypothetical protein
MPASIAYLRASEVHSAAYRRATSSTKPITVGHPMPDNVASLCTLHKLMNSSLWKTRHYIVHCFETLAQNLDISTLLWLLYLCGQILKEYSLPFPFLAKKTTGHHRTLRYTTDIELFHQSIATPLPKEY